MATSKNSTPTAPSNFFSKIPVSTIVIVAVALFIGFGIYWWREVYSNPKNVFQGMLNNSLRLSGITKSVAQESSSQSVNQVTRLNIGPEPTVISETTLSQGQGTTVKTESIGTPTEDFVRYTDIDTDQKSQSGNDLDFSSIVNVWGSQETGDDEQTNGELYNETVVGIVPFGNLTADQRGELNQLIAKENVYEVDYANVKRKLVDGRPTYTYQVQVDAEAYVKLIKQFAELTGLNNLKELNPDDYVGSERLPFTVTIDVWSRQLKQIENGDSGRVETYSGHNASQLVEKPKDAITVEELQTRLQSIQ